MFRPCIDLREGRVTQIVGGTLTASADGSDHAQVNFESHLPAAHYASLYQKRELRGGHVIMLGSGNEQAALEALEAYPNGLQVGGGITIDNAQKYLAAGASHVIVTSFVFRDGMVDMDRLRALVELIGKDRLVLDLSCRKRLVGENVEYVVVTDRWQKMTSLVVSAAVLDELSQFCTEFLVHGVDVEGKRCGIEAPLVQLLGEYSPIPVTYAGGVQSLSDIDLVRRLGRGRVDLTIGSALDIFGGSLSFDDVIEFSAPPPTSMNAVEIDANQNGTPDALVLVQRPLPVIKPGELLIKVSASGVNRPDVLQRSGKYPPPPGASDIPGLEVAGRVVSIHSDSIAAASVLEISVGTRVCALVSGGGYAEYCTAPISQCLPSPSFLTDIQAASLPETFFTVYSNLVDRGALSAGQCVLIHGGTSGIGVAAIQMARALGAHCVVTCGDAEKCQTALTLGAHHAINYREDWVAAGRQYLTALGRSGFDIILDMVAGDYVAKEVDLLADEGRLVIIATQGGAVANNINISTVMRRRLVITGSTLRPRPIEFKAKIAQALKQNIWPLLIAPTDNSYVDGRLQPIVHSVFSALEKSGAADAHRLMDSGKFVGKIVLQWK